MAPRSSTKQLLQRKLAKLEEKAAAMQAQGVPKVEHGCMKKAAKAAQAHEPVPSMEHEQKKALPEIEPVPTGCKVPIMEPIRKKAAVPQAPVPPVQQKAALLQAGAPEEANLNWEMPAPCGPASPN